SSHFKPSDYKQTKSEQLRLRINAVPFFLDPAECIGSIPNKIKEEAGIMQGDSNADVFCPSTGKEGESVPLVDITCVCSECGKSLINKSSLEFHMRVHTGAKTFICPHCDAYFLNKSHRYYHIRSVHKIQAGRKETVESGSTTTPKKSYACTECGKNLSSKQGLTNHMLQHAGVKPFTCPHCDGSFSEIHSRNHHIR
ncbi:hypothetical protein PMAYCL1PPCAC_25724, partial [Pristionchus mayeri]